MRYREFKYKTDLQEAAMAKRHFLEPRYKKIRTQLIDLVNAGSIKNHKNAFVDITDPKSVLKQINSNIAKIKKGEQIKNLSVDLGGGNSIKMNHIHKDQTTKKVIKVIGNILEGLTGLAVATKLAKEGDVTEDTMQEIGTKLSNNESAVTTDRGLAKDQIKFKFKAPTKAEEDLLKDLIRFKFDVAGNIDEINDLYQFQSQDQIKRVGNQCKIVVGYANTGTAPRTALTKFQANEFKDDVTQTISVTSDGGDAEKQSTTKVDLFIEVEDPNKEPVRQKLTSIKSGSGTHQGGQVTGKTFNHLNRFWYSAIFEKLPKAYIKGFNHTTTQEILDKGIRPTYTFMQTQISNLLQADNENNEKQFLKNMTLGLKYHTQMNEPTTKAGDDDVTIFIANDVGKNNKFNELQFNDNNFTKTMEYFDLAVSDVSNTSTKEVTITVTAKISPNADMNKMPAFTRSLMKKGQVPGKYLVKYRSKVESETTIRNTVDIGSQAEVLANVLNAIQKAPSVDKTAPAPAPAPTPPPQNKPPVQPTPAV